MEKLKAKALKKLDEITPTNYEDISQTIISYSQNQLFLEAKKLILEQVKLISKSGLINNQEPYLFLKAISKYLYNISISNYKETLKEETKGIFKQINLILKNIHSNFNQDYLLIENKKKRKFFAIENAYILNFTDELIEILNQTNNIKEADKLFMLKSKIELGFNRYFYNQKNKILIEEFDKGGKIKYPNKISFLKIINEYISDEVLFKNFEHKKEFDKFEEKLLYLKLLKTRNKTQFRKEFQKIKKMLEVFPENIWHKNFTNQYLEIVNSINKEIIIETKDIPKEKVLVNLNSIKTINLIIQIFKEN